jgi:outer membrane protein W
MKKLFVLAGAVVLSSSLFAQKPTSDAKYSLEGNVNYNATDGINWSPNVRARYFVNDKIAARLQVGFGSSSEKTLVYEFDDSGTGYNTDSETQWGVQLGAEYHLPGTSKMSPYFMAGINLGGESISTVGENNDGGIYVDDYSYKSKFSTSLIGLGIGAGMDYYVGENLYLGLELGWGWNSTSFNGGSESETESGVTVETKYEKSGSFSEMGTGSMNSAVRIGWRF